jgi:signal transduction histidine kinase
MGWQATIWAVPTLSALVVALFLAGYAGFKFRNGQRDVLIVLFFWSAIATIVWTGFSALKLLQTDPATKLLLFRLLHIGAAALPPILFLFVAAYTDRTQWLRPEQIVSIFSLPAIFVVLLFFNPGQLIVGETELITNGLVILRVSNGPGFLLFIFYSTALVLASIGLLLFEARRIGSTYYPQAVLLTLGLISPLLFSLLTMARVPPFSAERLNLVPTSATISAGILGVLLARYRLFDLPPMAYVTAMKHSPDSLLVLDRTKRIVHANDRGSDLLDRLGGQTGDVLTQLLPDFAPDATDGELFEVATENEESAYYRLFTESLTRGGRHIGWVVTFRDETTQQRQQRRLQDQNEQLNQFASIVSHDLRNPLNAAQLRLDLVDGTDHDKHVDSAQESLDRMETMIEDLLTLSSAGVTVEDPEDVSLAEVATESWETAQTEDADFELTVTESTTVRADRDRLRHIFENLFRNAVDHNDLPLTIRLGLLEAEDGQHAGFFIEDDGDGIPADERDEVFDYGHTTSDEGTGFGLSIVADIVDAHDWYISIAESNEGGARFEISGVQIDT